MSEAGATSGAVRAVVAEGRGTRELAALSRAALDRPLRAAGELLVAVPRDEAVLLGAYQRPSEVGATNMLALRRGSGGGEARVGPGSVWLQLALARPDALVACPPERLLNRYVRPLLRAVTKLGALAHYFDRDWVAFARRPGAAIGFAHDGATGRALVEAVVAVTTPMHVRARGSFAGKEPATLAELGGPSDPLTVARAIASAYVAAYGGALGAEASPALADGGELDEGPDPPWTATRREAIGIVGAGRDRRGRLAVGGELMASRDAMQRLEERLAALPAGAGADAVGPLVDATLGAPAVVFGVRQLASIRDAIVDALAP